jgi:hypothetical protein
LVNDVGSCIITIQASDERCDLFELDGIVQVFRCVPGLNIQWYEDFIGLYRTPDYKVSENGEQLMSFISVSLNDLLARTIINYKEGTIKAYKNTAEETCMKEYVEENCGASATVANERESEGVLPDFVVEADAATGANWEGDRAFQNLLDVLKEIANKSLMDFDVVWDELTETFTFVTHEGQLGADRTTVGLNPATGKNAAGNSPVVFSLENGTLRDISYVYNRVDESNVISVLGDGDGSTREIQMRTAATSTDSPWNRRESSRPQGGFLSEMQNAGDIALEELSAKEVISFTPLLQASQMYGKDFSFGDKVSVYIRGVLYHRKITGVTNDVTGDGVIKLAFADY